MDGLGHELFPCPGLATEQDGRIHMGHPQGLVEDLQKRRTVPHNAYTVQTHSRLFRRRWRAGVPLVPQHLLQTESDVKAPKRAHEEIIERREQGLISSGDSFLIGAKQTENGDRAPSVPQVLDKY
jgi:hypothetical protein